MFTFLTTTHTHTTTRVRPAFNTFQALFSFKYIIQAGVPGVASGIKKIFFEEKISNYYPPGSYGFSKQISAYSIQCSPYYSCHIYIILILKKLQGRLFQEGLYRFTPSGGSQAAMSHHYFPFPTTYQLFSLPAAMSHHYFPFRTPHLTLPGKTSFLNGIFRAFKV